MFTIIIKKGKSKSKEEEIKEMFSKALFELKYMGFVSQTKQSTFIFRKNFFGKAKFQKVMRKTDMQQEKEQLAISMQFGNLALQK